MATTAKLSAEIKNLVTKNDINSLKSFIEEQSALIKNLTEKMSTLDDKLNASEASIEKLNVKITNMEGKLAYFKSQDELKSRKIDDLATTGAENSIVQWFWSEREWIQSSMWAYNVKSYQEQFECWHRRVRIEFTESDQK